VKRIYLIRHCEAEGQAPEAALTERGFKQAIQLADVLNGVSIDRIIVSPYKRTVQSIEPLAKLLNLKIETNDLLTERVLSSQNLSDWLEKLRATFDDFELKFEGGESSTEAMKRIVEVVEEVFETETQNTIIVTHGNLLSLLLNHFNNEFGFDDWRNLRNPDVFLLKNENNKVTFERILMETQRMKKKLYLK
jgi:2,3-bisphosphoglycerate-dependent phosphoglycerate mutase